MCIEVFILGLGCGVMLTHIFYIIYFHKYLIDKIEKITGECMTVSENISGLFDAKSMVNTFTQSVVGEIMKTSISPTRQHTRLTTH